MSQLTAAGAAMFHHEASMGGVLLIWTVTTGTKDFGDKYIARPHMVGRGINTVSVYYLLADTLDELRDMLPAGLTRIERQVGDDLVIVEAWL